MRFSLAFLLLVAASLGFGGCAVSRTAMPLADFSRPGSARGEHAFFVGCRGWHSSITIERSAIPTSAWPNGVVERSFRGCRYVEVGWGDADFYMARHPTVLTALDAALLPGASVLLVVGLDPPLEQALPWGDLVRVPCTAEEFNGICQAIGATFRRDAAGNAKAVGVGLYGRTSRFYAAHGLYSAVQTCNHWTTRTMRAGGLNASLDPTKTSSSGAVVKQARRLVEKRSNAQPGRYLAPPQ